MIQIISNLRKISENNKINKNRIRLIIGRKNKKLILKVFHHCLVLLIVWKSLFYQTEEEH